MKAEQLRREADRLESSTRDNLAAWVILGEMGKYDERMKQVAALRRAAEMKPAERREFLRNTGAA